MSHLQNDLLFCMAGHLAVSIYCRPVVKAPRRSEEGDWIIGASEERDGRAEKGSPVRHLTNTSLYEVLMTWHFQEEWEEGRFMKDFCCNRVEGIQLPFHFLVPLEVQCSPLACTTSILPKRNKGELSSYSNFRDKTTRTKRGRGIDLMLQQAFGQLSEY